MSDDETDAKRWTVSFVAQSIKDFSSQANEAWYANNAYHEPGELAMHKQFHDALGAATHLADLASLGPPFNVSLSGAIGKFNSITITVNDGRG